MLSLGSKTRGSEVTRFSKFNLKAQNKPIMQREFSHKKYSPSASLRQEMNGIKNTKIQSFMIDLQIYDNVKE